MPEGEEAVGTLVDAAAAGVDDAVEPVAYEGSEEVTLVFRDLRTGTDKRGYNFLLFVLEIAGHPETKDLTHFVNLPHEEMDEKQLNRVRWGMKQAFVAFGIPTDRQVDLKDYFGAEATAILGVSDSDQWGRQNNVKKWIIPQG